MLYVRAESAWRLSTIRPACKLSSRVWRQKTPNKCLCDREVFRGECRNVSQLLDTIRVGGRVVCGFNIQKAEPAFGSDAEFLWILDTNPANRAVPRRDPSRLIEKCLAENFRIYIRRCQTCRTARQIEAPRTIFVLTRGRHNARSYRLGYFVEHQRDDVARPAVQGFGNRADNHAAIGH